MRACPVCQVPVVRGTFCGPAHRLVAWRIARGLHRASVASQCVECSLPLEQSKRGRKRVRCGSPQCEEQRLQRYFRWQVLELADLMENLFLDVPLEDGVPMWLAAPIKGARFTTRPTPGCDVDPLAYARGWDAEGFVAEFGRSGDEVGQTFELVGATLGAGCGGREVSSQTDGVVDG